jgi:hypothetical protein
VIIVAWVALLYRRCSDSRTVLSFDDCDADYCVNMSRSLWPCYDVSAKSSKWKGCLIFACLHDLLVTSLSKIPCSCVVLAKNSF